MRASTINSTISYYNFGSFSISFNKEMGEITVHKPNELFHKARNFSADLIAF